jgi:hypothetical protein
VAPKKRIPCSDPFMSTTTPSTESPLSARSLRVDDLFVRLNGSCDEADGERGKREPRTLINHYCWDRWSSLPRSTTSLVTGCCQDASEKLSPERTIPHRGAKVGSCQPGTGRQNHLFGNILRLFDSLLQRGRRSPGVRLISPWSLRKTGEQASASSCLACEGRFA